MHFPVIDLHCDLLAYLEVDPHKRSANDDISHCSIPLLKKGGVKLQVLAIFAPTSQDSAKKGMVQAKLFSSLPSRYPEVAFCRQFSEDIADSSKTHVMMAVENASGFFFEWEPFKEGWNRLNAIGQLIGKPLYISLTWNGENRFGGGNQTKIGLKEDGKRLLDELHEKNIAVDLSHTSDALADDILNYLTENKLAIPVMASHSNARRLIDVPRNLPDAIAKEIFHRGGVVGLNFYNRFVGSTADDLLKHAAHWFELGGGRQICFGADFFYEGDATLWSRNEIRTPYFPGYEDASCYPAILQSLQKELRLTDDEVKDIAWGNAARFIGGLRG